MAKQQPFVKAKTMADVEYKIADAVYKNALMAYAGDADLIDLMPTSDKKSDETLEGRLQVFNDVVKKLEPLRVQKFKSLSAAIQDIKTFINYLTLIRSDGTVMEKDLTPLQLQNLNNEITANKELVEKYTQILVGTVDVNKLPLEGKTTEEQNAIIQKATDEAIKKAQNPHLHEALIKAEERISMLEQQKIASSISGIVDQAKRVNDLLVTEKKYISNDGTECQLEVSGSTFHLLLDLTYAVMSNDKENLEKFKIQSYHVNAIKNIAGKGHLSVERLMKNSEELKTKNYDELCQASILSHGEAPSYEKANKKMKIFSGVVQQDAKDSYRNELISDLISERGEVKKMSVPNFVPILMGAVGIGKSVVLSTLANSTKLGFKMIATPQADENKISAYPIPSKESGMIVQKLEASMHSLITNPSLIFFDEFNRGRQSVVNSLLTTLSASMLGEYQIHLGSTIVAATNLSTQDDTSSLEIGPAASDRFIKIAMPENEHVLAAGWLSFTKRRYSHLLDKFPVSLFLNFLTEHPKYIYGETQTSEGGINPASATPRSWSAVVDSAVLDAGGFDEDSLSAKIIETVETQIGAEVANEFRAYIKTNKLMPKVSQLIEQVEKQDIFFPAVTSSIGATIIEDKTDTAGRYFKVKDIPTGVLYRYGGIDDRDTAQKQKDNKIEKQLTSLLGQYTGNIKSSSVKQWQLKNPEETVVQADIDKMMYFQIVKDVKSYIGSTAKEKADMLQKGNVLALWQADNPDKKWDKEGVKISELAEWSSPFIANFHFKEYPELQRALESKEKFMDFIERTINTVYRVDRGSSPFVCEKGHLPVNAQNECGDGVKMILADNIYNSMISHISAQFSQKEPVSEKKLNSFFKLICAFPEQGLRENMLRRIKQDFFKCSNREWINGFQNYGIKKDSREIEAGKTYQVDTCQQKDQIAMTVFKPIMTFIQKNTELRRIVTDVISEYALGTMNKDAQNAQQM